MAGSRGSGRPRGPALSAALRPANAITRGALRLCDLARRPLERAGVEYGAFRALLASFLVLDERRGARRTGDDARPGSPFGRGFVLTCVMNLVVGSLLGLLLAVLREDPVLAMGALHTGVLAFATLVLVADYSAVLLDDTDAALIGPLPVTDRTFFAARIAHIAVYVGLLLGSLALPGLLIGCAVFPLPVFAPVYVATVALTACLALALAFGFFLVALRFLDIERLKGAVLWVQMTVTVLFMAGLQLLPRLIDVTQLGSWLESRPWVAWALPPCHQGALLALALGDASGRNLGLAALAVALPLLALTAIVLLASRGYLSGLGRMAVSAQRGRWRRGRTLGQRLLRDPERRAGFDFCAALARRERQFRLRVYPMLGFAFVVGLAFALREREHEPAMLCGAIYLLGLYVPMFVVQARFSENWEARWILLASPLRRPGRFAGGANAAIAATLLLPMFALLLAIVLAIGGRAVLVHALFATELMLAIAGATTLAVGRRVPFTEKASRSGAQGSFALLMVLGVVVTAAVALHAAIASVPSGLWVAIAALVPVLAAIFAAAARMDVRIEDWGR